MIKRFFATVPGSIFGVINGQELLKTVVTSLGAGSLLGVIVIVLQAISDHAAATFPSPAVASTVTCLLSLLIAQLHRLCQGETPAEPPRK